MGGVAAAANQQQGGSGIFGGAAGAPPTDTARGLPMATGFGGGSMTPQAIVPMTGGPGMGPPSGLVQQPTQVSPVVQQMMMRQQQPMFNPQLQGLQQLYSMFNRPQMRMPMQMPVYRNPALAYRPNMAAIQQNLSRVKPSVYKTDLDAARARIAEFEAAEEARRMQEQNNNFTNYG